jgi:sterol desaturase/sphingolipid hydroxylase (fatty acid hydroxylase superfamily)
MDDPLQGVRLRPVKRLWPYAATIGGVIAFAAAVVVLFWPAATDVWPWVAGAFEAKLHRFVVGPAGQLMALTIFVIILELFVLNWEQTTAFRVFVRRSKSAMTDLGFALITFSSFKWLVDYVFSLGIAFAAVKLSDALATRIGWMRWELPANGVLEVVGAFAVYYLMVTFVGYWQHRLMHWRWFWQLHRFHHSATDFNVLTGFRANPGEMISNLIPTLSPLIFLKVPDAGLFAVFVFINLTVGQLQHTELPWSFGWIGRWIVTSPRVHQIHHSIDEEHRDKNFSNCPLWDQLFGTWYSGPNRPSAYGIPDPAHMERPATQWLIDIWIFYRDLAIALASLPRLILARIGRAQSASPAIEPSASKVDSPRSVRLWPYAAAIGVLAVCLAMFVLFQREAASDLWSQALGFVEAKWRRGIFVPGVMAFLGTMLLLVLELFFLSWKKTTVFIVFVRRKVSAIVDLCATIFFFSTFKSVVEYVFTLGIGFAIVKLTDAASARYDWVRWELPSEGALAVIAGFAVYYLFSSFIGYWQHRLMHWRWFWQLHRFHHAATEFNVFTTFRVNPAEAITVIPAVLPFFFLKVPSTGLFAVFIVANQVLASLQHSSLPWTLGWLGRWVITAPTNHQVHHSIDPEHRDKNFSSCPLWDHMFGTWYGGPNRPSAYGIPDPAHVERPLTQWLIDVWIFYRDIARSMAGAVRSVLARITRRQPASPGVLDTPASIPAE